MGNFLITIGLVLDIAGVVLLFFFGLPSKVSPHRRAYRLLESSSEEPEEKFRLYKIMSNIGLILLILGFSFQIAGNYLTANCGPHCTPPPLL